MPVGVPLIYGFKRKVNRHFVGAIERAILEPLCYIVGKNKVMEIDFNDVYANYEKLNEEEKELIRAVMSGPAREIIGKVFGTKFESYFWWFAKTITPKEKGGGSSKKIVFMLAT